MRMRAERGDPRGRDARFVRVKNEPAQPTSLAYAVSRNTWPPCPRNLCDAYGLGRFTAEKIAAARYGI
jgi:hypothetical protein